MKRAFEHVAIRTLREAAVAVQPAKPLAVLGIGEMREAPVVPVFLHGQAAQVGEVEQPAVVRVPAARPTSSRGFARRAR